MTDNLYKPQKTFRTLARVEAALALLEVEKKRLEAVRDGFLRKTLFACRHCKESTEIRHLTFLNTHWYEPPHGCTGGDIWHRGNGAVTCRCGRRTNLVRDDDLFKLRFHFESFVDVYD